MKERWEGGKGKEKYMKKGTGIGGGQTGKFVAQGETRTKSYQGQIKELKKLIEGEPKSPRKYEKNVSPENDVRGKDTKIKISNLPNPDLQPPHHPQPAPLHSNLDEFTLQPPYLDESLSFDISKSHQPQLPEFNTKTNAPLKKSNHHYLLTKREM